MSFAAFYRRAEQALKERFPSTAALGQEVELDHLLSPHRLRLPKKILTAAQAAVSAHYQIAALPAFVSQLEAEHPDLRGILFRRDAVLMAYDFHTTKDGRLHLVEVNTNASSFLLALLLEAAHGKSAELGAQPSEDLLWEAFQNEWRSFNQPAAVSLAICDEGIPSQKMLVEFLMYRDWFEARGWRSQLCEAAELKFENGRLKAPDGSIINFVYNRLTDFYLSDACYSALREACEKQAAVVSPHPWAFALFADKGRLAEMSRPGWLEKWGAGPDQCGAMREVLIPTYELHELGTTEEIWAKRKTLFFKPRRSHGGKSAYRGASVSRKVFERLLAEDTIVQNSSLPSLGRSPKPTRTWRIGNSTFVSSPIAIEFNWRSRGPTRAK